MKIFREPSVPKDQRFLLPPSVDEFVGPDDKVRVLSEVLDNIDSNNLYAKYRGGGAPAYDPLMLVKILIFGSCQGILSSRKLARMLAYDVRFMFLAEMSRPDFRTIWRFRKSNEAFIQDLFVQSVRICRQMGLVLLEHEAVDGTKLEANVSGKQTYSAGRLEKKLTSVEEKIADLLAQADEIDAQEDAEFGDASGDEIPEELRDLKRRKEKLLAAKKALEETGRQSVAATDLDSRLMKTNAGNRPAYNAQAVVDGAHQIVVAAAITQDESDNRQLQPMLEQAEANTGGKPQQVTADGGYFSASSLAYVEEKALEACIPDTVAAKDRNAGWEYHKDSDRFIGPSSEELTFYRERTKRDVLYRVYRGAGTRKEIWVRQDGERAAAMRAKMQTPEAKAVYRLRQQIVEPFFGHIKGPLNLRRLSMRGLSGATTQYLLACTAHNMLKLTPHWSKFRAANA